ncbi:hypothetical protein MA16_Dca016305 [Dendrobium catenatum]|uniref:Uncharacterized protein n=1 Tax=Dendrobium catenatum TaxID=906689 RepID=A0A2I0W877_9ASPA|nr:hypothetical protein MA16_Dca016305 [Dendrobium catenatum]
MPHDGGSAKNQGFSRDFRHKRVYLMLMRRFEQELGKTDEKMEWESSDSHSVLRRHLLEFLIDSAQVKLKSSTESPPQSPVRNGEND